MSWTLPQADMTAGWDEIPAYLLSVCLGAGKTVAGQEGQPQAQRARREVVILSIDGADTGEQRKDPSVEWRWTYVLGFTFPGRQKAGTAQAAMADLEPVATALQTGNPNRGWRISVKKVSGRQVGEHFRPTLTVEVLTFWRAGLSEGTDPQSASARAAGGLP